MKRIIVFNGVVLLITISFLIGCILTKNIVLALVSLVYIIITDYTEYNIQYILKCYKLKREKKLEVFKLNKFQKVLTNILLKDILKELNKNEELHKEE